MGRWRRGRGARSHDGGRGDKFATTENPVIAEPLSGWDDARSRSAPDPLAAVAAATTATATATATPMVASSTAASASISRPVGEGRGGGKIRGRGEWADDSQVHRTPVASNTSAACAASAPESANASGPLPSLPSFSASHVSYSSSSSSSSSSTSTTSNRDWSSSSSLGLSNHAQSELGSNHHHQQQQHHHQQQQQYYPRHHDQPRHRLRHGDRSESHRGGGGAFSLADAERMRRYVEAYRDGADRACFCPDGRNDGGGDDDEARKGAGVGDDDDDKGDGEQQVDGFSTSTTTTTTSMENGGGDDNDNDDKDNGSVIVASVVPDWCRSVGGVWIAGHVFPPLTDQALIQPFLSLPSGLGSKQRKFVHELCIEVGLFHCSVGEGNVGDNRRRVAISIHADGFEYAHNITRPSSVPVRDCKPWYYRTNVRCGVGTVVGDDDDDDDDDVDVDSVTAKAKKSIQSLIDQPGRCLRDAHDSIDFSELDGRDLSVVPDPMKNDGSASSSSSSSSWMLVDSGEKMMTCVKEIEDSHPSEIAFDLEMHNQSMYEQSTCLIQLSTDVGKDYVIDVLAPGVWNAVPLLSSIFADPSIVKVGHAIGGMDVPALHRDFGTFVVNAFDTHEAARVLRLKHTSLASVCEHYGLRSSSEYSALKKIYQASDWRKRPLSTDMIKYGLYDVHYLLELRRLLIRDLTRGELWDKAGISRAVEARIVAKALAATMRAAQEYEDGEGGGLGDGGCNVNDSFERSTQSSEASDEDGYFTPMTDASFDVESRGEDDAMGSGDGVGVGSNGDGDGDGDGGRGELASRRSLFRAKELRMVAQLMKVITISQDRCISLWKGKDEPHMKNKLLMSLLRRAATENGVWTGTQMSLYKRLVEWRKDVAAKLGMMPAHVCPLDLLVLISYKRPDCVHGVRKLSYFLPDMLENNSGDGASYLLDQILALVRSSLGDDEEKPKSKAPLRFYANRVKKRVEKQSTGAADQGSGSRSVLLAQDDKTSHVQAHSDDEDQLSEPSARIVSRGVPLRECSTRTSTSRFRTVAVTVAAFGALVIVDVIRKRRK